MKAYSKPVISIDTGLAEGVYAASGASSEAVTLSSLFQTADWGFGNGQLKFTVDFSALPNLSNLSLTVTFSHDITNAWGNGPSATFSGQQATFTWYAAPQTAELYIQVDQHISDISITGYSYANK